MVVGMDTASTNNMGMDNLTTMWRSPLNDSTMSQAPLSNMPDQMQGHMMQNRTESFTTEELVRAYGYVLMSVLGITFNLLTIMTLARGRRFAKGVKIELCNLAVADLISAAFIPIYCIGVSETLSLGFVRNNALCKIVMFVGSGAFYVSPLWSMVISVERLVIVFYPLQAHRYTRRHKHVVAGCVWSVGLLIELEKIMQTGIKWSDLSEQWFCTYIQVEWGWDTYYSLMAVKYCLPAIIITVSYAAIGIKLCRNARIGERGTVKQATRASRRKSHVSTSALYHMQAYTPSN